MENKFSYKELGKISVKQKEGDSPLEEKEMDKKGMSWMQVIQSRVYKRGM